ncbi:unnamed protein product [Chrysoparadoxa australica]
MVLACGMAQHAPRLPRNISGADGLCCPAHHFKVSKVLHTDSGPISHPSTPLISSLLINFSILFLTPRSKVASPTTFGSASCKKHDLQAIPASSALSCFDAPKSTQSTQPLYRNKKSTA